MGKPGPKPKWRKFTWSPNLAYAIGLFASDGCLYNDGRHISLVSRDIEQLENFKKCLDLKTEITFKSGGVGKKKCPHLQFSDVALYNFFLSIGLTPNKSKTIGALKIPQEYFFDFLRGEFDGDGSFYSYFDPRWRSSFMFYISFVSASPAFILWLRKSLYAELKVRGHISATHSRSFEQLRFAKAESLKIIKRMYYSPTVLCLSRKRQKIERVFKSRGLDR